VENHEDQICLYFKIEYRNAALSREIWNTFALHRIRCSRWSNKHTRDTFALTQHLGYTFWSVVFLQECLEFLKISSESLGMGFLRNVRSPDICGVSTYLRSYCSKSPKNSSESLELE
jgi:hypothetical protein